MKIKHYGPGRIEVEPQMGDVFELLCKDCLWTTKRRCEDKHSNAALWLQIFVDPDTFKGVLGPTKIVQW